MNMKTSTQPIEGNQLISVNEAAKRLGIVRRTLERQVSRRNFPQPLKIGAKSLYAVSDVEAYVRKLMEQRSAMA
jgi:predicted DNA-binding transcriptional regulator AlpA